MPETNKSLSSTHEEDHWCRGLARDCSLGSWDMITAHVAYTEYDSCVWVSFQSVLLSHSRRQGLQKNNLSFFLTHTYLASSRIFEMQTNGQKKKQFTRFLFTNLWIMAFHMVEQHVARYRHTSFLRYATNAGHRFVLVTFVGLLVIVFAIILSPFPLPIPSPTILGP